MILNKSIWTNRTTTRFFSEENTDIPKKDLKYLQTVINNIPSQCSIKGHFWMYLGRSERDMKLRTWLQENVFWIREEGGAEDGTKEYMLGVMQAPAILFCVRTSSPWANTEPGKTEEDHLELSNRSESFFAGAILATLLNMKYKVATFGCVTGFREDRNKKEKVLEDMIKSGWGDELESLINTYPGDKGNWDDIGFFPSLATCFGPEAAEHPDVTGSHLNIWTSEAGKEYHYVPGVKTRTPAETVVGIKEKL
jgi:hypothetical protein